MHIVHPFKPIYDENSLVLILGSMPSVASRKNGFYYGHPQNRFWKVLAAIFEEKEFAPTVTEETIPQKIELLYKHQIALWDVIGECDIEKSSDSSIKNAAANNIEEILKNAKIHKIILNGKTAEKLYRKFWDVQLEKEFGVEVVCLPSTSPANAAWNIEKLCEVWKENINPHKTFISLTNQ